MNALPQVRITRTDTGWLTTCTCGHETWHPRRPGADRAAHEHRAGHHTTATRLENRR